MNKKDLPFKDLIKIEVQRIKEQKRKVTRLKIEENKRRRMEEVEKDNKGYKDFVRSLSEEQMKFLIKTFMLPADKYLWRELKGHRLFYEQWQNENERKDYRFEH